MSLFDSASLVVTPNGVKEGKLYSIKPTDASGDLSVTRATTATRVNSAGLVELVPYNLLTYSQDFSNAAWTKQNLTLTSGQTSPIGDNTAFRAQFSGVAYLLQSASTTAATASVYARATSGTAKIRIGDTNGNFTTQYSLTTEWQRITTSGSANVGVSIDSYVDGGWTTQDVQLWGAQLVQGTSAKDYQKTETRLNIPRLDYTNGSCPSILVEPQRTNLFSYSEQFDNAYWGKTNMVIVANDTTAPDGTTTADKATASFYPSTSISKINLLTATNHTLSVYVKAGSVSTFRLDLVTAGFALGSNCIFNLSTLATTITNYGTTTGSTAKITSVGNGWYRCSLTVLTTAVTYFAQLYPAANGSVYLWGAQLEAGSYATSYIPTVASSVTRNADVISKTGISSLIGQTEGTMFFDLKTIANNDFKRLSINGGSYVNSIFFDFDNSNSLYAKIFNGGSAVATLIASGVNIANRNKIAIAYKNNDFSFYVNGVQVGSQTSGTVPSGLANFEFSLAGNQIFEGNINTSALWKTRLTNAELATLTTI